MNVLLLSHYLACIKPSTKDSTHLIVGAGLAGCLLAWKLQQRGAPFRLIGSSTLPSAFSVAAGVINPVTGRWMTKSWNFDQLLPEAVATYQAIERQLGIHIYHPIPAVRFCKNEDDVKRAGRRLRNPRYSDVLGNFLEAGENSAPFKDSLGSFEIKQAAYVDLPTLVDALRNHFQALNCFRDETFQHDALVRRDSIWRYGMLSAPTVTFCEGAAGLKNPFFKTLPLQPAKGETLLCTSPSLEMPETLFHHKKWFLPYPDGSFRLGASYDESELDPEPTEQRKHELLEDAQWALKEPHELHVTAHQAGNRPGTNDSRPIVGPHPEEPGLYLLNGLGSKGASTGPLMARLLSEQLLDGAPIPAEVEVARFKQSYSK